MKKFDDQISMTNVIDIYKHGYLFWNKRVQNGLLKKGKPDKSVVRKVKRCKSVGNGQREIIKSSK